jgi:hypothetical protein
VLHSYILRFWDGNEQKRKSNPEDYKPQIVDPKTDLPRTFIDARTTLESLSKQKQYQRANEQKLESLLGQMKQNQVQPKSAQSSKKASQKDEVILANLIT